MDYNILECLIEAELMHDMGGNKKGCEIKVILVGDERCGKSALLKKATDHTFSEVRH